MEEKRLTERFNDVFANAAPILEDIRKGFYAQKLDVIRENKAKFKELVKTRVSAVQKIMEEPNKSEAQRQFLALIPSFQMIGLAFDNLINKMETKIELKILFSEKALAEIDEIYKILEEQFQHTKDYIITKNPALKSEIKKAWERIFTLIDEYAIIHQNRMITGVCVPKASYLYLDIVDSIKRFSRGLIDFAEKV